MFHLVRGSAYFLLLVQRSYDHVYIYCAYLWYIYDDICLLHLPLHVLFLFYLYTHVSCSCMQSIYFCFTQRCLDEFCLKCFRNTSCQSLLAINPLLAKIFKSLYLDRFYCIQQVNMGWVIYDFSHIFICLLWFCHRLPKGRLLGYMWFMC